jgi:hypothetical protein
MSAIEVKTQVQDEEKQPQLTSPERTYLGSGSTDDPYVVDWDLNDPEDPYNWSKRRKWLITMQVRLPFSFLSQV